MKRFNNLYEKIYSIDNLILAEAKARKGKSSQYGVKAHDKSRGCNVLMLHEALVTNSYKTSPYTTFKIYEPKEREIFRLPFYPDRIAHHAIMNVLEPLFTSQFTADTYSCIKGKGIHGLQRSLIKALKDVDGTKYCLKLDIRKFYPSIDHDILKRLLRRKFKDIGLLQLLDGIIDSAPGVPIGNYLSQYLANFFLSGFDHWIKEKKGVRYYFRYADDIVILSDSKVFLRNLLYDIADYLQEHLNLYIKKNYRIFPVSCGVDIVGYVHYHTHVLLRPSIKKRFARMLKRRKNKASIASYYGWTKHCNSKHLLKKLLHETIQPAGNCAA